MEYIRRVWASAWAAVDSTKVLGSRHEAYEVLAALRDRIETTPWRGERGRTALRVLRAHLNFAEIAGGPLHHASERQTAEEAPVPAPRPDEIPSAWHVAGGRVLDPVTGRPDSERRVATDGRLILITPSDQRSYDELAAAHAEALSEWESAA
ncbi:hypothetical protein ACLB9X_02385 [Streptomyces sp. 5K101]|uniref:hypothetical protein n=1 Tax=Streptomyces sp. 5K101 TaxID=3390037 RepID=UPI003976D352